MTPRTLRREIDRFDLPGASGFTWHGYVPGLAPGALYGFRVHGPYAPERGHRCNPAKLLVDPYAKALLGRGRLDPADVRLPPGPRPDARPLASTSATAPPACPRVRGRRRRLRLGQRRPPDTPWRTTIIYETHVRGLTKLHPDVPSQLRGTYAGLAHPASSST